MTWSQIGIALFAFAILCEQAHIAAPIVRAWGHPGLRQIALSRPIRTLVLPVVAVVGALLVPLMLIWWVYWAWNIYHFGAQHYGVGRLLGWRVSRWWYVGVTAAIMAGGPLLIHAGWWKWFILIAIDFNHWLVDVGLSSYLAKRWWLFLIGVTALGCIGFAWKIPRADHVATLAIPWVIQLRWGVGIWHFDTSQWVWKLSDPLVRATIGKELFA